MVTLLLTISWLNFAVGVSVPWYIWIAAAIEICYGAIKAVVKEKTKC